MKYTKNLAILFIFLLKVSVLGSVAMVRLVSACVLFTSCIQCFGFNGLVSVFRGIREEFFFRVRCCCAVRSYHNSRELCHQARALWWSSSSHHFVVCAFIIWRRGSWSSSLHHFVSAFIYLSYDIVSSVEWMLLVFVTVDHGWLSLRKSSTMNQELFTCEVRFYINDTTGCVNWLLRMVDAAKVKKWLADHIQVLLLYVPFFSGRGGLAYYCTIIVYYALLLYSHNEAVYEGYRLLCRTFYSRFRPLILMHLSGTVVCFVLVGIHYVIYYLYDKIISIIWILL